MDVYILRHGKAEERLSGIKSDAKRKLTISGKNDIEEIAKGINNFGVFFDYIVSSPLVRSIETANIVAKHLWKKKKKITTWDELKPESDVSEIHKKLVVLPPDAKVLLVGHEPHLTHLISSIISDNSNIAINLKKGGFACIRGNPTNSKIVGSLRSLLTPKQLKLCK
jgi:phosphohistidine phosphatase